MEEEREEEEIRMVDGNLIIPRRYLNDLESLQREIRNKPTILDYLLHEDTRLANAILSEVTVLLAEFLFGKQDEERNSTDIEKKKTKTIAKTKYEARVRNPELRRENIRRSRIFVDVLVNGKTVGHLVIHAYQRNRKCGVFQFHIHTMNSTRDFLRAHSHNCALVRFIYIFIQLTFFNQFRCHD